MGFSAYLPRRRQFQFTVFAGKNDSEGSFERHGYAVPYVGGVDQTYGSINAQPIPGSTLYACNYQFTSTIGAGIIVFSGNIVPVLSGYAVYMNGALLASGAWTYVGGSGQDYTAANVTGLYTTDGGAYLIELRA